MEALRALHAAAFSHGVKPARADASSGPFYWWPRPAAGVICGDFNCEPGSDAYRRLLDAWAVTHPRRAHDATVGLFDRAQWPRAFACDFAFVSADLAPRVAAIDIDAGSDASDHQPMLLTLAR